jgi:GTPase SAR1 family protein
MSDAQILHFFGGKGGSGKTTLALAFAQNLSDKLQKEKILLVSLDASHALSDVLKKKLGPKPSKLQAGKGQGGVRAREAGGSGSSWPGPWRSCSSGSCRATRSAPSIGHGSCCSAAPR